MNLERENLAFELFSKRFAHEDFKVGNVPNDEIIDDMIYLSFKAADRFRAFVMEMPDE